MKLFLTAAFLWVFHAHSQHFRISPDFYTTSGNQTYDFHVTGNAELTESMVVEVELRSTDGSNTVLFSGIHSFADPSSSTLTGFMYDQQTGVFYIPLGNYPSKDMELWVRSLVDGEAGEVLLIVNFDSIIQEHEN